MYVGFDSKVPAAFWVQRASILRHSPGIEVIPVVQQVLRAQGVYYRETDPLASTEFTYTRFLVPYLAGYKGLALFMDGDMLVRGSLWPVFQQGDVHMGCLPWPYAMMVVPHDHHPPELTKMAGQVQTQYRRKNWSSFMLFDCDHEVHKQLTPEVVNTWTGAQLHQLTWVPDELIGHLDVTWNWLEGHNTRFEEPDPKVVHFTRGIPGLHTGFEKVDFADEYLDKLQHLNGDMS